MSHLALRRAVPLLILIFASGLLLVALDRDPGAPRWLDRGVGSAGTSATVQDSATIASRALQRCGPLAGSEKEQCYDRILSEAVKTMGARPALGALRLIGDADPVVATHGHRYTHLIGLAAYTPDEDVGAVFASCSPLYQSGCYHGVIQAYFSSRSAVDTGEVRALCGDYTRPGTDQWLRFQCVHGMGHGLTMLHGGDLPRALDGCGLLEQAWDRESCYGGAFMENVVGSGGAGHHGGAAEGAAPHDHGHPAATTAAAFRTRDPADPHYPCSVVEERHLQACYSMQASIMLELNGGDFRGAAQSCDGAPAAVRATCYQSLGTNVANLTRGNDAKAAELCAAGNPAHQAWCFLGVVKNRVDVTARLEDGLPFCRLAPGRGNALKCYEALGEQATILKPVPTDREAFCAGLPGDFAEACRFGARLTGERPAGLPGR